MTGKLPGFSHIKIGLKELFWKFLIKEHRRVDTKTGPETLMGKINVTKIKESVRLTL